MKTYENIMTTFRFNHLERETITELNNLFKLHGIELVLEAADNVGIIDESNFYLLKSDLKDGGWKVHFPSGDWDMNYHLVNNITGQHFLIDIGDIDRMEELTNIELLLQLARKEVK